MASLLTYGFLFKSRDVSRDRHGNTGLSSIYSYIFGRFLLFFSFQVTTSDRIEEIAICSLSVFLNVISYLFDNLF